MISSSSQTICLWIASMLGLCQAILDASETPQQYILRNDRLFAAINKTTGSINSLSLDEQDLLGSSKFGGPYLDCSCVPSGSYTPGKESPVYQLYSGVDSSNVSYGGVSMNETYPSSGLTLQQFWFLRDGETGLHTFSRVTYFDPTRPSWRDLAELRTLFRPSTKLWTNLTSSATNSAPLPRFNPASNASVTIHQVVQDATWYIADDAGDPYATQYADYFTKYTFSEQWRDHDVHGLFSDGSTSMDGSTFGAWLVMNTKETYFGGPTHSDLTVDGIIYDYMVSNHHGAGVPNITDDFDRTFGPQYYYFNRGPRSNTLQDLRNDALQYYAPGWNAAFYDDIAKHVPGYFPSSSRTTFKAQVGLPTNATRAIAILTQNGVDYQDNAQDIKAYQYWADISANGTVQIDRVKTGTYRLTIYADGIFGQYIQDGIVITCNATTPILKVNWVEPTSGIEIFRIGVPDKSCGEYANGKARDLNKTLAPEKHRIYWGAWDFPTQFPNGVNYTVGKSDPAKDLNYVHWSFYPGSFKRSEAYYHTTSDWTIAFELAAEQIAGNGKAAFTVQLAGAKTAAGNTDKFDKSQPYSNLPYTVNVNGKDLEPWIIPYYHSSSCAIRSAATCYTISNSFVFNSSLLKTGRNEFILSLPFNGSDYQSAKLPNSVYVQYDAMRLEIGP